MAKNSPWGAIAVLGTIVAGAIGIIALVEHNASAKPASPPPQPQPSPAGAQTNFLALITDPATVRKYQTQIAGALASGDTTLTGISAADYSPSDVDGDPNNPRWRHVVSAIQAWVNKNIPAAAAAGKLPAGFPFLRTDGVLDQATAFAIDLG